MARASDPFTGDREAGLAKGRGGFLRGPDDAPWVAHPTKTAKHKGDKASLLALCAERGIDVPTKATVAELHELLGPRPARVKYGSPSGFGAQLEDSYQLIKWMERRLALGIGHAVLEQEHYDAANLMLADLARLPEVELDGAEFRTIADSIVARAKDAAQTSLAADRGTHMHAVTDDIDTGRDWVERVADGEALGLDFGVQAGLAICWHHMLESTGVEVLAVEASCVDDDWRLAGTLDRIVRLTKPLRFVVAGGEVVEIAAGTVVVLDTKTGEPRRRKHAIQIASYAQSVPYDTETDDRGEWGFDIDQQWALIAHLDVAGALAGNPSCTLVLVDLVAGREHGGACVAMAKAWAARNDLYSVTQLNAAAGEPIDPAAATDVASAPLAPQPPRVAADATPSEPDEVAHGADATLSPLRQAQQEAQQSRALDRARFRLRQTPEEGEMSDERSFAALRQRYDRLTKAQASWIAALGRDAEAAGVGFSSKETKTVRRFEILRALVILAGRDESDDAVRQLLALVDPTIEQLGSVPLGHIIGSLSATEAATFARLVNDELVVRFADDGTVRLTETAA
jgi:hypothetical protein